MLLKIAAITIGQHSAFSRKSQNHCTLTLHRWGVYMYFCWLVYRGRIQAESIKPDGLAAGSREYLTTTISFLSPILPCLPLYVSVVSICLSASVWLPPSVCLCLLYRSVCLRLFVSVCFSLSVVSVCLPPSGWSLTFLSQLITLSSLPTSVRLFCLLITTYHSFLFLLVSASMSVYDCKLLSLLTPSFGICHTVCLAQWVFSLLGSLSLQGWDLSHCLSISIFLVLSTLTPSYFSWTVCLCLLITITPSSFFWYMSHCLSFSIDYFHSLLLQQVSVCLSNAFLLLLVE
jgi:hypothetical protein